MKEKRIKGFAITSECVTDTIKNHWFASGWVIPNDVRYRSVQYDYERDTFIVFLESPEFDVVPDGSVIPVEL